MYVRNKQSHFGDCICIGSYDTCFNKNCHKLYYFSYNCL